MCDFKFEILSTKHETNSNFPMTKTMLIKILKWVPDSWNSARPPDFVELLGFGNSDFGFDYGVKPVRYSTLA